MAKRQKETDGRQSKIGAPIDPRTVRLLSQLGNGVDQGAFQMLRLESDVVLIQKSGTQRRHRQKDTGTFHAVKLFFFFAYRGVTGQEPPRSRGGGTGDRTGRNLKQAPAVLGTSTGDGLAKVPSSGAQVPAMQMTGT